MLATGLIVLFQNCGQAKFSSVQVRQPTASQSVDDADISVIPPGADFCTDSGIRYPIGQQITKPCVAGQTGRIILECMVNKQFIEISNTCANTPTVNPPPPIPPPPPPPLGAQYRWAPNVGACSANPVWLLNNAGTCQNVSCNSASQTVSASCSGESGVQTTSYICQRISDSQTVGDSLCTSVGARPASYATVCSKACNAAAKPSSSTRACPVVGTPCRYSFVTQFLVTNANNPHPNRSKCSALAHVTTGYHGVSCSTPFKAGLGGDVKTVAFNGGNGSTPTTWNSQHPGDCATGYSVELQNVYACLGVCKSGQWKEVNTVVGSAHISSLTGDQESPLSNPYSHPQNAREIATRVWPHYRCIGQE